MIWQSGVTTTGSALATTDDIHSYGAGIRLQALREQNVWVGVDIAKGPEEYAWYVQVGHAWWAI